MAERMQVVAQVVFPTHVGVNRRWVDPHLMRKRVPHARGGEPVEEFRIAVIH